MRHPSVITLVLAITACLSTPATTQDFPPNKVIASCADVRCPSAPNSVSAQCTVVDKTFTAIGQARVPVDASSTSNGTLAQLSWVQGVAVRDRLGIDRTYDKSFYFGSPPELDLGGTAACAIFFTRVSAGVSFGADDLAMAQGTCQQAMSSECVAALAARAKTVNVKGLSSENACAKLQQEFQANLDSACTKFATASHWDGIISTPLSGALAAQRITPRQNATSNCWPILPKQNVLTLVQSFQAKGDVLATTLNDIFYNVTPILTYFYPANQGAVVSQPEAQLTCLKTVGLSVGENATRSPGDANHPSVAALTSRQSHVTLGLLLFVFAALFLTF